MPVNTLKALNERLDAKVKETRDFGNSLKAKDNQTTEEREKFNGLMDEVNELRQQVAQAKKLEEFEAEFGENRNIDGGQLDGLTPGEQRDDKIDPVDHPDAKGYRLGNVLNARMQGKELTGVEAEVHAEMEKRSGATAKGVRIPLTLQIRAVAGMLAKRMINQTGLGAAEKRELNALTTGTAALPTVLGNNLIDFLRNVAAAPQAGVTIFSGLEGTFEMPKVDGIPTFSWGGRNV